MNIMKRILSLLLCVAMLAAYLPAAGSAAAAESNVTATVDKTVVNVGEEVKVTLSNKEMTVASIGAGIRFDKSVLECVSIVAGDPDFPNDFGLNDTDGAFSDGSCSTVAQANKEGTVGFVVGGSYDLSYEAGTIFVATFKALKKGTVDIVAYEDSANIDDTIYKGNANTLSVTVKGPNVYLAPGETSVTVDESITVTLSYSDLTVYSFNCGIKYDTEMLECVSIEGHNPNNSSKVFLWNGKRYVNPEAVSTIEDAKREGAVGVGKSGTAETTYKAHDLFTVTFKALKTGNTTITVYERSDGPDGWENENVETRTITIKPLCEHSDSVNDGNHTCDLCGEPDVSEHITDTKDETTPNSCTEEGKVETVTFCSDCGKELNRVVKETIPAGHTWSIAYTWADDYSTCTAVRSCTVCEEGKAQETVTASAVTTGTNCTDRKTTYTANFAADWAETQTKEVNLPAEHGELKITINKTNALHQEGDEIDGYSANCGEIWTLTVFCVKCRTAVMEVKRDSVVDISRKPTCTEPGQHTHTTSFADVVLPEGASWDNRSGNGYDGYRTVIYDPDRWDNWNHDLKAVVKYVDGYPRALGHSWNTTPAYYRDNKNGTHTAIYTCKNDVTHEKEGTTANHTFVEGKCVCGATQSFTATFLVDGVEYASETYKVGATIHLPENPSKDNDGCTAYIFTGWEGYTEGMTMGTKDVTFEASFTESDAHTGITHVEAKTPTCYENGNIEYWYCEACGQAWLDAECTKNTDLKAVVLPAAHGEITHVADKAATCTEEGNIEYWYCKACGQVWLDEGCTISSTLKDVVLPVDEDAHTESIVYLNLGAEGHKAYYPCCQNEENAQVVPHDFGNDEHTCVCDAVETFAITWVNVDGTELGTTSASYGDTPAYAEPKYPNANPGYKYTFEGWANAANGEALTELPAVTGEATYYAVFTQTARTFLIDWMVKGWEAGDDETGYIQTSVMYGEPITAPKMTWLKEGYTFSGWQNVPANMPADNLVIYGEWTVNSYTVTWIVDGETYTTTTVEYGSTIIAPEMTEEKEGYTFSGWTAPEKMPAEDITLDAVWTANTYTVTWNVDGNTDTKTTQTYGAALNLPTDPEKTGYIFAGWFTAAEGGDQVAAETVFKNANNDTVYYAQWTAKMYQINWYANGGYMFNNTYLTSTVTDQPFGAVIQTPPHNAYVQREGYTFTGWNTKADGTGEILTAKTTMTEASNTAVVYYAQWEVNKYDVTFTINNEEYKTLPFAYGAAVTAPDYTVPEGHNFSGWTVPTTMPAENLTIDATLTVNKYDVTFTIDGKEYTTLTFEYGAAVTAPEYTAPEGYTFSGWDVPAKMPAKDLTIDATLTVNSYKVTFNVNGKFYAEKTVAYGAAVTAPDYTVPEGHSFSGWTVPTTMPAENLTIDATLTVNKYDVTFTIDGKEYTTLTFEYGAEVTAPDYTVPEGHSFSGWTVPEKMPAEDLTIDATLTVNTYPIVLLDVNGNVIETREGKFGDMAWLYLPDGVASIAVNDENRIGTWMFNGLWMVVNGDGTETELTGTTTIPVDGLTVRAQYVFTGWVNDNGWHYEIENEIQKTGWTEISHADYLENGTGTDWYYLDPVTGYRVEGVARAPYPTEAINGITYAPDRESIDYANKKGQTFIDETEGWFIFDDDGKFQFNETGMGTYFGATRYAENGHIAWHPGMIAVGEDYYYFIGDVNEGGNILATGDVYISRNKTDFGAVKGGIYTFGVDGKLCKYDGITDMADGSKRYYEKAQLMIGKGLVKNGENYIYVRSNGELVVGEEYWVAKVNGHTEINVGMANFDENGYMIVELDQTAKTGIYANGKNWVYYVEGCRQYNAGLVRLPEGIQWFDAENNVVKTADGESYVYVRSNGQLATGTYWITQTNGVMAIGKYDFDAYGVMLSQMNGVYLVDNALVYYVDNQIAYNAGLIRHTGTSSEGVKYDNDWIYVRSNGQLATGTYWITNTNEEMASGKYTFDADGKMIVTKIADGIHEENGKLYYYQDGVKQVGTGLMQLSDGSYIYVKSTGELVVDTDYYVTNNHGLLPQAIYYFGADGIMVR